MHAAPGCVASCAALISVVAVDAVPACAPAEVATLPRSIAAAAKSPASPRPATRGARQTPANQYSAVIAAQAATQSKTRVKTDAFGRASISINGNTITRWMKIPHQQITASGTGRQRTGVVGATVSAAPASDASMARPMAQTTATQRPPRTVAASSDHAIRAIASPVFRAAPLRRSRVRPPCERPCPCRRKRSLHCDVRVASFSSKAQRHWAWHVIYHVIDFSVIWPVSPCRIRVSAKSCQAQ